MAYDAEATRQRIRAAATEEFAARGIAGARVDRIATNAKANKQAIYAYFGGKQALFTDVLRHAMAELAAAEPVDADDLGGFAGRLFDYHRQHPQLLRLLLWEALERGDREVSDEAGRTGHYEVKTKVISEGQAAGQITDQLDPAVLMLFVQGLVNWGLVVPQVRRMLGADLPPERLREQIASAVDRLAAPEPSA